MITREKMVDLLNKILRSKRQTDNYADGVMDMYNAVVKELEGGK